MSKTTVRSGLHVALRSAVILLVAAAANAQWLNLPTPGTPRLPDGTANLKAPAPKTADGTPDFSGIWHAPSQKYLANRQIFTDGRALPKDPEPAWFGYSVGRWDGDTLVVDTTGIHEKTWLDDAGHPHSEALHVVERFRRVNFGRMDVQITIDDPKAYTKPWSVAFQWELMPDTDLLDWVCENNKYFDVLPRER